MQLNFCTKKGFAWCLSPGFHGSIHPAWLSSPWPEEFGLVFTARNQTMQKERTDWQCWQVIYLFQNGSCYGRHINKFIVTCFCHPHLLQLAPNRGHGVRRRLSPSSSDVHRPSENVSFKICELLVYPSNRYWTWKRGPSKIIVSFTKVPLSTSMILGGRVPVCIEQTTFKLCSTLICCVVMIS